MIIGLLKEPHPEKRVALLPEAIPLLKKLKIQVLFETEAGSLCWSPDSQYIEAGAEAESSESMMHKSDVLVGINIPENQKKNFFRSGQVFVGTFSPLTNHQIVKELQDKKITSFSLDAIPRTTRAQAMDVLSSMATIAGYRAVLDAALHLPTFFPMFMSAAGTIRPAKLLILGAGVAGLQAIAVARKLGAVVEVFDVRSAVKEEVQSLGAKFIEVEGAVEDKAAGGYAVEQTEEFRKKQSRMIQDHAAKSDVVICTAQIPGMKAPVLIRKETVIKMKPGSVIVDLAASTGGNCELTVNDKTVHHNGVAIIGNSGYAAGMPVDASRMYGKNLFNFIQLLTNADGNLNLNMDDEIIRGTCITHDGEIINERVKSAMQKAGK